MGWDRTMTSGRVADVEGDNGLKIEVDGSDLDRRYKVKLRAGDCLNTVRVSKRKGLS